MIMCGTPKRCAAHPPSAEARPRIMGYGQRWEMCAQDSSPASPLQEVFPSARMGKELVSQPIQAERGQHGFGQGP